MKKSLGIALALVLCLSLLSACGGGNQPSGAASPAPASQNAPEPKEPEETPADETGPAQEGKLIVGLDDTFAPMGFRDEAGNLVGFDIDLANAVGEEMGVEIIFQPIDWDAKQMELDTKNIDCIWNGMSRRPDREEAMTLSQDYLSNRLIIMTTPDVEITSIEQLAEYQIGTQAASSALDVISAHEIFPDIEANLHEYRTYDECILDMQAGRVQAMIVDEVLGKYKNTNLETKFNVSSADFGEDFYTIGFRKADTELCRQVEEALKAVIASGKGEEISAQWFGENKLLDIR